MAHSSSAEAVRSSPSLLIVTTVSVSMGFHLPFVRHFRDQGWRVDGAANGIVNDERVSSAFENVYELPFSRSVKDVGAMIAGARALAGVLEHGYDIVHVHTPIAAFVTRAVVRRLPRHSRPRIVYTAHGFHFHRHGHRLTNAAFITAERIAGRWTDRLVVINDEDEAAALQHKLVPRQRLRRMHGIGVDTDWYAPERLTLEDSRAALKDLGVDPDRPYFVSVGELNRNKRPTDIVRALAAMRDSSSSLLFLGVGPERERVEQLADELGVRPRVVVPGTFAMDIRPLVATAIALVQASKREGLPRSIMEALALEVPVIATEARGCHELVGSDRGFVVPIGGIGEMAVAMDHLVQHARERREMGKRGRELMRERYELRRIIDEHERLYDALMSELRAGD